MEKAEFVAMISQKLKLIRAERGYSQQKMAELLSISNKTLVEIEKGRKHLGFCGAVAVATIFEDSEIVGMILGDDVQDSIKSLALEHYENLPQTMGGKVWWQDISSAGDYRIQQNVISQHYRILTADDRRVCSSFDRAYIDSRLAELSREQTTVAELSREQ